MQRRGTRIKRQGLKRQGPGDGCGASLQVHDVQDMRRELKSWAGDIDCCKDDEQEKNGSQGYTESYGQRSLFFYNFFFTHKQLSPELRRNGDETVVRRMIPCPSLQIVKC